MTQNANICGPARTFTSERGNVMETLEIIDEAIDSLRTDVNRLHVRQARIEKEITEKTRELAALVTSRAIIERFVPKVELPQDTPIAVEPENVVLITTEKRAKRIKRFQLSPRGTRFFQAFFGSETIPSTLEEVFEMLYGDWRNEPGNVIKNRAHPGIENLTLGEDIDRGDNSFNLKVLRTDGTKLWEYLTTGTLHGYGYGEPLPSTYSIIELMARHDRKQLKAILKEMGILS